MESQKRSVVNSRRQRVLADSAKVSPINKIPVEIFQLIGRCLSPKDFCALRATCRQADQSLLSIFGADFIKKRQIFISTDSLRLLAAIASSPRLSFRLTHLVFNICSGSGHSYGAGEMMPSGRHVRLTECGRLQNITGSTTTRDILESVFSKLENLRIIELRDYNTPSRCRDSDAERHGLHGTMMSGGDSSLFNLANQVFSLVLNSLFLSSARPQVLDINTRHHANAITSLACIVPAIKLRTIPLLASIVKIVLHISLDVIRTLPDGGARFEGTFQILSQWHFCNLLFKMPNVEHLRLNCLPTQPRQLRKLLEWLSGSVGAAPPPPTVQCLTNPLEDDDDDNFIGVVCSNDNAIPDNRHRPNSPAAPTELYKPLPSPIFDHLSRFDLGNCRVTDDALLSLVRKFQKQLRSLSLVRVHLCADWDLDLKADVPREHDLSRQPNYWSTFLIKLTKMPDLKLREFMFRQLSQRTWLGSQELVILPTKQPGRRVTFANKGDNVNDKLSILARSINKAFPRPSPYNHASDGIVGDDGADDDDDDNNDSNDGGDGGIVDGEGGHSDGEFIADHANYGDHSDEELLDEDDD